MEIWTKVREDKVDFKVDEEGMLEVEEGSEVEVEESMKVLYEGIREEEEGNFDILPCLWDCGKKTWGVGRNYLSNWA